MTRFDDEHIAWILLDAIALGDGPAARKWKIHRRTVERYRARLKTDAALAALVSSRMTAAETELSALRVRFLRRALVVLELKITLPSATVYEIAGAVKIVGELHQISEVLSDGRPDGPDPDAEEAEGDGRDQAHGPH